MKKMTEQDAKRLAAYEATGLTPEGIENLKRSWANCRRYALMLEKKLAAVKKVLEGD